MGAQESKPATITAPTAAPINEKRAYLENLQQAALAIGDDSVPTSQSVEPEAIDAWSAKLENVGGDDSIGDVLFADDPYQDPSFKLARLVLSHSDPVAALQSRTAVVADEKIFNLDLKGAVDGKYPGPVVNQKSSGRCWLFATSE